MKTKECRVCAHFQGSPEEIERVFKGLTSLSSGYGSTRGSDGLCLLHERLSSANSVCLDFVTVEGA